MLVETSRAGAPFPHCGAAHGASGGPLLPPERIKARFTPFTEAMERRSAWCDTNERREWGELWAGAGPPGGTVRRAAVRKRGSGSMSLYEHRLPE